MDLSVLSSASMAPAYSIAATFGLMIAAAGAGAPLALVLLTIPVMFIAIAFHRMCEEHPDAGSTYAWARLAFGQRTGGFSGWIVMLSYFGAAMATIVPAGVYTLRFLNDPLHLVGAGAADNPLAVAAIGSAWIVAAGLMLVWGMRPTADTTAVFLVLEIGALLLFAGLALLHPVASGGHSGSLLTIGNGGGAGFLAAMVLAIWVADGWEISTYTSEENTGSARQPGSSALVALGVTTAIMLVCAIAFMRVAPLDGLAKHATDTLAYVADQLGGGWRTWLMVLTVIVSTGATLWTGQLGLSRLLFSAARDGLLPRAFGRVHARFGTPAFSIAVVTIGALVLSLLVGLLPSVYAMLDDVDNIVSILLGMTFILTGAACVTYFLRKGTPWFDVTRVLLPAAGTIGLTALLVKNFQSQTAVDQWAAIGCVIAGVLIALLTPMFAAMFAKRRTA
ncbi:MAG: APC family permease [Candidatus Eremiobacteraeota bacterium]|nr:APC family permease [Candidatus Eremiobacteraeota bacterium]